MYPRSNETSYTAATTTSASTPTPSTDPDPDATQVIVGAVLGSLALILLPVILSLCHQWRRKRRQRAAAAAGSGLDDKTIETRQPAVELTSRPPHDDDAGTRRPAAPAGTRVDDDGADPAAGTTPCGNSTAGLPWEQQQQQPPEAGPRRASAGQTSPGGGGLQGALARRGGSDVPSQSRFSWSSAGSDSEEDAGGGGNVGDYRSAWR